MDLPLEQMEANAGRASSLLKSMANEVRLMILCQLSQQEMTVSDLAQTVPLSQSALSQHLGVLRRERLVKTRRESQFVWYSLDSAEAQAVIATLYDLFCAQPEAGPEADGPGVAGAG
ncbi:metalloregulator ArsR/SmtB family transcription factor [Tsuneonella sp. YG55]|uniref:Metalloregulator ArsR/SmtB family transcription factor n=1 Tax=Tsuneonella litorea TaxID=2976475 RepID=A0A9X3AJR8_9SPHN|nr:metalloregulator ArsR/SmtB family transcription factor [Tsuneonella litorea]MCT2557389.1 metalloregulator ArsR/SmtB family transcription factor [Tsuneonella litorea]